MWAFSSCGEQELLLVAVPRASLCSGFSFCRAQASANPKLSIQPSPAPLPLDSSVQFSHSVVPDSLQLMDCSITNPEPAQTHVHQVGDAIQPSYLLSSRPFLLLFQSFPALGSFPTSQFFTSGAQNIDKVSPWQPSVFSLCPWFCLGNHYYVYWRVIKTNLWYSNTCDSLKIY